MTRTTRSTVRRERGVEDDRYLSTAAAMSSPTTFDIPQRSSSCAPSTTADFQDPSSGSTIRDEDVNMQNRDHESAEDDTQSFGQRSKKYIKAIRKLEDLGIDPTLPSLPKFVMVGDQSHGKSSVVEAVCGISLPRSAGTCTRCPFRITTTAAQPEDGWSCTISLGRKYVCERGSKWKDTFAEPVHFATVTEKTDLERVLRLAQVAILNPRLDTALLLRHGAANVPVGSTALSFSFNAIDLHISGHELPELSIVDLPGSINVAPDESEQYLVKMIEKLIKTYVEEPKALILLVASMDQDLETSTAFRFVRDSKALGRSLGVMTKPDLLTKGRFEHIRRILKGEVFKLGLGWHVTKNAPQEKLDRSITHTESRGLEEQFFRDEAPWGSTLLDYADHFGTKNLQDVISHRLVDHIEQELPTIIERVNARLKEVTDTLEQMPAQPTHPMQTVIEEAQKLVDLVKQCMQGNDNDAVFRTELKETIRKYRTKLQAARPQVQLGTPGYVRPVLSVDSDDETMSDAQTPSKRHKNNAGHSTPSASTSSRRTPQTSPAKGEQSSEGRAVFDLRQIHAALDQASTSDLPDQVHPKVTERFIKRATAPWSALTEDLLDNIQSVVGHTIAKCISEALSFRQGTELFTQTIQIVEAFCRQVHVDEAGFINHLVECENHKPITYAGGLKQSTEETRTKLKTARLKERMDEYFDTLEAEKQVKVPTGEKRKDKCRDADFVTKTLGPDRFASEVSAMASPLAYYDLASGRLLDTVANHVEFGIVYAVEKKLQVELMLGLKVTDAGFCARLLAEDPAREAERLRLGAEREKLVEAVEELKGLPGRE